MLPNWLLGKSKSKLQEILGGGGGGTDYKAGDGIDISSGVISFDPLTTPAIDPSKIDGLNDDLTALAPKTAISNPNILHNPWFQVNQRKVASANTTDVFIVDRWKTSIVGESSGTFTVNSNGTITIANTSQSASNVISIYQKRTDKTFDRLKGRKVTLSVMLADGTVYSGTEVVPSSGVVHVFDNEDISLGFDEVENKIFSLHVFGGKTVTIKALKLEVGEISTLAMDTAPDMAIELLKCQRYFQRLTGESRIAFGMASTSTALQVQFTISSQMRATPTISGNLKYGRSSASSIEGTIGISGFHESLCNLLLNDSNATFTIGDIYSIYIPSGAYLDFNAEL